jgi:tRNA-dihydrouridine synthase A
MLDWTDRHCRYFHRLLSRRALLYTEMVTTGALIHGDVARHLRFNSEEQPLALQLGGSDPLELAQCARLAEHWGYTEINLNCGCPSERVQRGSFGACLMNEPMLVADCVKSMVDMVGIAVTVKHRIGIDQVESYDFVRDFVGAVSGAGCSTFIVHARNAWLKGLSPKDNRDIPPLRYDWAYRLKRDFPELVIVLNGGVTSTSQVQEHLTHVDGVMIGREAYHNPWWLQEWDSTFFAETPQVESVALPDEGSVTREYIEQQMVAYMEREGSANATPWPSIAKHMLGLRHGLQGSRRWRRIWSDHSLKALAPEQVMEMAHTT